jgi:hypothetical protein
VSEHEGQRDLCAFSQLSSVQNNPMTKWLFLGGQGGAYSDLQNKHTLSDKLQVK